MKSFAVVGIVGILGAWSFDADACSRPFEQPGYVTALTVSTYLADDYNSPKVCVSSNTCGLPGSYEGVLRYLSVEATVQPDPAPGGETTWIDPNTSRFQLKDDAGNVVAESGSYTFAAQFLRVAAKACVTTSTKPVDGGATTPSEVCVPVTVTSLDVTQADRDAHLARAKELCGQDKALGGNPPGAGSPAIASEPAAATKDDGGGCNASSGAPASGGLLALLGLAFAATRRRARVRRDGGFTSF
jgi:MYXO-CTERM domain-containing protein